MNNGLQTERAHMGVFSTTSYISIGDPYAKKSQSDDRMKGRQFISQYPKRGLGGAAEKACYFDRQFPSLFIGEKYVDRTMYLKTQPPDTRKNGFGSSDAKRRDEFSNDVEVNKWRERIKNEMEFVSRFASQHAGDEEEAAPMEKRWTHGPEFSFDVGKETAGGVTPYQMKDERDTWYSKERLKEFRDGVPFTGSVKLSSYAVGDNLQGYSAWSKPEFARQPIIRDSFFRSTGVMRGNPYATGGAM